MRKPFVLVFIAVLIITISLSKSTYAISKLHVDGRWIKNETGNIIILKGVNKAEFTDSPDNIFRVCRADKLEIIRNSNKILKTSIEV